MKRILQKRELFSNVQSCVLQNNSFIFSSFSKKTELQNSFIWIPSRLLNDEAQTDLNIYWTNLEVPNIP